MFLHIQSALHISGVNQPQIENIRGKNSKKQDLNLCAGNNIHSIYSYLHSTYIVLDITNNLEMI